MEENRPMDDDLQRIREERLRELEAGLLGGTGRVVEISDTTFQDTMKKHPSSSSISGRSGVAPAGWLPR